MQEIGTRSLPVEPLALAPQLPRVQRRRLIRTVLVATDLVMLLSATLLATWLRFANLEALATLENTSISVSFIELSLWLCAVWLFFLHAEGLYDLDRIFWGSGEFSRIARALSMGVVGFILVTFALKVPGLSRAWVLIAWLLALILASGGRMFVRAGLAGLRRRGRLLRPALVVGSNGEAEDLLRLLGTDPSTGIRPVGCLASSQAERLSLNYVRDVPCIGFARDVCAVVRDNDIDTVVIASSAFDHDVLARIVADLRSVDVDVHVSSGLFEVLTKRVLVREISGVPLITVKGVSLSRMNLMTKRAFDLLLAGLGILVGLPVWIALAVSIRVTSTGPVFYRQQRIGRDGEPFMMLKFRSMYADAEERLAQLREANEASGPLFKMRDDPRVTPVGKWMRKFSIDEFPQLINVMRGEMSLVGPRPPLPSETRAYTEQDWRRLEVLPGMTGLWQVSGRSNLTFAEMVRLDLFYIENWSVTLDLALLLRTVPAVLAAHGAY